MFVGADIRGGVFVADSLFFHALGQYFGVLSRQYTILVSKYFGISSLINATASSIDAEPFRIMVLLS
jgi:hypothetical protein